jgi:hypothetical protein
MLSKIAFTWDEVGDSVNEQDYLNLKPQNNDAIMRQVTQQISTELSGDASDASTFKEIHVEPNGVIWAEGRFNGGRHEDATFYHPTNPELAKARADAYADDKLKQREEEDS